jgi:hypothetical protein
MDSHAKHHDDHQATKPHYELGAIVAELGFGEVCVLTRIARRLAMGERLYGRLDLANDTRDFRKEAREEIEDFLVYAACGWLKREAGQ